MSAEPSQPLHFGRYETLFPIATGGMAEVYAARVHGEAGFQKLVALKRMKPELAENARFVTMFLDEGRMAANISSPNVVSTLDLGRAEDNSLFLVMELVTGVSLAALLQELTLRRERIPVEIAVEIIAQAANGLHDAHEAVAPTGEPMGIIHRDCSPHNVLVDIGGQVKITDFGIAKAMERQTQSQAGEMKGKLTYLSPEQARGNPVDRRCDVFILGVVAWELIAQRRLFNANSTVEVLHRVVAMPITRLDALRSDVPEGIADAVEQALQRDPDERFATAAAFGHALHYTLGDSRPRRSAIGAYVRAHGGPALLDMERRIRETFGTSPSRPPPPAASSPAYPIPLAARAAPRPFESRSIEPSEPEMPAIEGTPAAPIRPPVLETTAMLDPLDGATIMDMPPTDMEEPPDTIPTQALKGVRIELGPPPAPTAPASGAPPPLPSLPTRRSLTLFAVFAGTLVAVGGGIGAAWLLRGDVASPGATGSTTAATTSAPPSATEPPLPRVAPPDPHPETPPPTTTPEERVEALEALEAPEPESEPTPEVVRRPRRRRRGVRPRNVTGDEIPSGDRQAAFDEIPW